MSSIEVVIVILLHLVSLVLTDIKKLINIVLYSVAHRSKKNDLYSTIAENCKMHLLIIIIIVDKNFHANTFI